MIISHRVIVVTFLDLQSFKLDKEHYPIATPSA